MKIANTEVAGIAGGLYESFENLGLRFFSVLIGAVRAERRELEYKRVTAGATLVGVIVGLPTGVIGTLLAALASDSPRSSLGCFIIGALIAGPTVGALLFWILASILIRYVKNLRTEDVRSASVRPSGASFETVFEEAQKRYLDSGYPTKDAHREAWWFAALSTGTHREQ